MLPSDLRETLDRRIDLRIDLRIDRRVDRTVASPGAVSANAAFGSARGTLCWSRAEKGTASSPSSLLVHECPRGHSRNDIGRQDPPAREGGARRGSARQRCNARRMSPMMTREADASAVADFSFGLGTKTEATRRSRSRMTPGSGQAKRLGFRTSPKRLEEQILEPRGRAHVGTRFVDRADGNVLGPARCSESSDQLGSRNGGLVLC
jgi:hypothetical protein